jgi:hypothetical protein
MQLYRDEIRTCYRTQHFYVIWQLYFISKTGYIIDKSNCVFITEHITIVPEIK